MSQRGTNREFARSRQTTPVIVPSPFISDQMVYMRSFKYFLFANNTTTHKVEGGKI